MTTDPDSGGQRATFAFDVNEDCPAGDPEGSFARGTFYFTDFQSSAEWCDAYAGFDGVSLDVLQGETYVEQLAWVRSVGAPLTAATPAGLVGARAKRAIVTECLEYKGSDEFQDYFRTRTTLEQGFIGVHALDLDAGIATLEVHLPGMAGKLSAVVCDGDQGVWWKDRAE